MKATASLGADVASFYVHPNVAMHTAIFYSVFKIGAYLFGIGPSLHRIRNTLLDIDIHGISTLHVAALAFYHRSLIQVPS